MTRKDYKFIAAAIAWTQDQYFKGRIEPDQVFETLAVAFCENAELDNPRFNRQKFLEAAGVTP